MLSFPFYFLSDNSYIFFFTQHFQILSLQFLLSTASSRFLSFLNFCINFHFPPYIASFCRKAIEKYGIVNLSLSVLSIFLLSYYRLCPSLLSALFHIHVSFLYVLYFCCSFMLNYTTFHHAMYYWLSNFISSLLYI